MFRSINGHHQGSFLHVSIHKGTSSGIVPTSFNKQGFIIREHYNRFRSKGIIISGHSYMLRSTKNHFKEQHYMFRYIRDHNRCHSYMFWSKRDLLQESFLHVSIRRVLSSGIIPTCFIQQGIIIREHYSGVDPQGIIIRDHSYMFWSTRDHHQGLFLYVSIIKVSTSEIIPTCFVPLGIIIREHY